MSNEPSMKVLEALADKALEAKLIADQAKEIADEAQSELEYALELAHKLNPDMKALGHTRIKISPNRAFSVAKAQELVTKKLIKECTVPQLDVKLLKANMTANQIEAAMVTHARAWKVGLSVLEDD